MLAEDRVGIVCDAVLSRRMRRQKISSNPFRFRLAGLQRRLVEIHSQYTEHFPRVNSEIGYISGLRLARTRHTHWFRVKAID